MIAHYLAVALAKFKKTPLTTAANVLTLALGLACFIAAYGIASYLSSSDGYHANADRTFIIGQSVTRAGEQHGVPTLSSNPALGRYLGIDIPELESVVRITPDPGVAVSTGAAKIFLDVALADPGIVDIFDFDFVAGDASTALDEPGGVILTQEAAARLFGEAPAVGQRVIIAGNEEGVVTGVIGPVRQPSVMGAAQDSAIRFDMLRHFSSSARGGQLDLLENWSATTGVTFAMLPPDMSIDTFGARLEAMIANRIPTDQQESLQFAMHPFPVEGLLTRGLDSILFDGSGLEVSVVHVLIGLGALTLLVACVNYANLATAQGATRAKEVGMRKVLGAGRGQVMAQAWLEAVILTAVAVAVALAALALAAPAIGTLSGVDILYFLSKGVAPIGILAALVVAVAVVAGGYPAVVLSRVRPAAALQSGRSRTGPRFVARILVGVQFVSASFLLILVTVSQLQRDHLERTALAPRQDPVVVLNDLMPIGVDYDTLAAGLQGLPGIESVTVVDRAPWNLNGFNPLTVKRTPEAGVNGPVGYIKSVGYDYFETLNLELLAGRVFDRARDTTPKPTYFFGDDPSQPVDLVIDRQFAERLGFPTPEAAIEQIVYRGDTEPAQVLRIIGVTETDTSRLEAVNIAGQTFFGGTIYTFAPRAVFGGQHPVVRIAREQVPVAVASITETWNALAPDVPVNLRFYDDLFEQSFRTFARISQLFALLAGCAFVIASVGLLGIAVHVTSRRRHEIGVRKTLGSTTLGIVRLLLVDFSKPVLVGNLLAWPIGYFAAQTYLAAFAHRASLTPAPFAISLVLTLAIAWVAVIGEVLKAASVRPAEVLRNA
jgi:putative ABC transport system permease protein